jgi:hypothetical protein
MPYDDNEKLKDQVGMLVGLFNADNDEIIKLAKVQLIQLGKKALPILKVVLDDMRMKVPEYLEKVDEIEKNSKEEESKEDEIPLTVSFVRMDELVNNYKEEENKRNKIPLYQSSLSMNEIEEGMFRHFIVTGVLDALSFYADDTLIQTFSDWLPWKTAVDGLLKIGSENAFRAVTQSLSDLFSLDYVESKSKHYLHDKRNEHKERYENYIKTLIISYLGNSRYKYNSYDFRGQSKIKDNIIKQIADFVDKDVIFKFVNSYPTLSPGLKDIVVSLIIMDKNKNFQSKVLEWADNGSSKDVKRLSVIKMEQRLEINRKLSKRLLSKSVSDYKETKSFIQYLMSNLEVDDLVEMELELYLKTEAERSHEKVPEYRVNSNRIQESPEPEEISNYIISKLKGKKEDAISYISKVLIDKNKIKVKAASWLLNQIT